MNARSYPVSHSSVRAAGARSVRFSDGALIAAEGIMFSYRLLCDQMNSFHEPCIHIQVALTEVQLGLEN